jgi:L-ascorbate metabolism protein UlaG (beta-lactamase superfamily)
MVASTFSFAVLAKHHEGIAKYHSLFMQASPTPAAPNAVRVTFMGVACLLFDDGEHSILVDGFFTRPSRVAVILGKVAPDPVLIHQAIARAGMRHLDAVVVSHSHYDHAMDCGEISKQTGAVIVGSQSTAMIARGYGVPNDHIRVMRHSSVADFGQFHITFVRSAHAPSAAMTIAGADITKPLASPARAFHYQEGGTYSILIDHGSEHFLVQSSAGFVPGALHGRHADVIFLGVGLLGKQTDEYREKFWTEVVDSVGAKRLIPIHWDDFMKPLDEPLVFAPRPFDEVESAIDFVLEKAKRDHIDVKFLPTWTSIDPMERL